MHLGESHQESAGGLRGLVELAGTDEAGSGVGRDGQLVLISIPGAEESRRDGGFHLTKVLGIGGGAFSALGFSLGKLLAFDRFLLGKATFFVLVATAAGAGIIASGFGHRGQ